MARNECDSVRVFSPCCYWMAVCGSRTCFLFLFPADFFPLQAAGCAEFYLFFSNLTSWF